MKKNRIAALALGLVLAVSALAVPAFAEQPAEQPDAAGAAVVELEVEKQLIGDTPPSAVDFTFVLEAKDGAPMPQKDTLVVTGAGTGKFGAIEYTVPGDYAYTLREVDGKAERYTYDATVYDVTVQVTTDDTGALTASVYMAADGVDGKAKKAVFRNSYAKAPDPVPPPTEPSATPPPPAVPQTSDGTHNGLWLILLLASGLGMIAFAFQKRSKVSKKNRP